MSHDYAWAYGSDDLQREANEDAAPGSGEYICDECEGCFDFADGVGGERDKTMEADWHAPVTISVHLCPACANRDPFSKGQRVRFVACPSLTGTVTARRHCHVEGAWKYTVVGDAEGALLGDDYGRVDLEAI